MFDQIMTINEYLIQMNLKKINKKQILNIGAWEHMK